MTNKLTVYGMELIYLMDDLSVAVVPAPQNKIESPLTEFEPTSSHEKNEATNESILLDSFRPQRPKKTAEQKKQIMGLLASVIGNLDKAGNPLGHCVRLTAIAEVCMDNRLPGELILEVLAHVEPNEMYHVMFTEGTNLKEWITVEEYDRGEFERP